MKKTEDFIVTGTRWLNSTSYLLELRSEGKLVEILAGNFAELEVDNSPRVFLRRPFSFYDADPSNGTIRFFVKVIGEGTRLLGQKRPGDRVSVIYPLGNTFSVPGCQEVLVVAGGSGIAPFLMMGRELVKAGKKVTFLFGARTREDIVLTEDFTPLGQVLITTEDGTLGEKGRVTDHSIFTSGGFPFGHVMTCGPEPMMKAVARIAREKGISCEVSLENSMACGFGACLCCITETINGNKCVCTEGPVFNINVLTW